MKLIALDVGTKRIGVAKADSNVRIAVPYAAVEVDGTEFKKIASLARAWDINCFVLGLPRNASGEETKQSAYVREFAKQLKRAIPTAKICFQDESLTSVEAEKRLKNRKKGYKKGDVDSEAATIILQDFLEEKMGKKTTTKAASVRRSSVKARRKHHIWSAIIVLLVIVAAAGAGAYFYYEQGLQPVEECTNKKCSEVAFKIASGSSVSDIADDLKSAGIIRSTLAFQVYYRLNYSDSTIKVGEYTLNSGMSVEEVLATIVEGDKGDVFRLMFKPGETIWDLKDLLREQGYRDEEIDAALVKDYSGEEFGWLFDGKPAEASLEGYLFGETYEFYISDNVETIITTMLSEAAATIDQYGIKAGFESQGLNLYQGITLASIVQKEANSAEDQAKVAKVFLNRLGLGMSLGSDVTVSYAYNLLSDAEKTNYPDNATKLTIDSPYNTRLYAGLPYGPICNPGLTALQGVATPDMSMENTIFFLTGDDQKMYYSDTEEGHNWNKHEYCHELCEIDL